MNSFNPVESLTNASQVTFILPHFMGPFSYLPHGMILKADIKMSMIRNETTKTGPDIPAAKRVAPVNNTLHSLFRSCKVWLGETLITKNGENYPFKSYFIDVLSNDGAAKFSWMEGQMFYQDNFGSTLANQTAVGNSGFGSRMNKFKVPDQTSFHQGEVTVMGRLHTDLSSCQIGILPGVGMKVELTFSSSNFLIQKPVTDVDEYKIEIKRATLFCPVAQLSAEMFRHIEKKLDKDDARFYVTRSEVTNKSIPSHSAIYTDALFPGANLPSKLILAFVKTENYVGTQTSNPFFFQRDFPISSSVEEPENDDADSFVSFDGGNHSRAPAGAGEVQRQGIQRIVQGGSDVCFIEQITLKLNGDSLDGFDGIPANWREDMGSYIRLHYYMGFMQSRTGNTLTYDEFMHGFYFVYFDLSTSSQSNMEFVVPAVRQGNLHLQVKFAKETPKEVTMLLFAEYPTLIKINKNRQISMSY